MNACNEELFPIFDEIAENYIKRCKLDENSEEYAELDRRNDRLYLDARNVFIRHNGPAAAKKA